MNSTNRRSKEERAMKQRNPIWLRLAAIASILAALAFSLFAVSSSLARPATGNGSTTAAFQPGNNGTVKIDNVDFDAIPDENPHQSCSFFIQLYGFDKGSPASYSVT